MTRKPITQKVKRLRQRQRGDGSWRIWWEPETAVKAMGFDPVELDDQRLTWSVRKAESLNRDVDRARRGQARDVSSGGRTLTALIDTYRKSRAFLRLAQKTRADYDAKLRVIDAKWGGYHVADFDKPTMHEWYQTLYDSNGQWQAVALLRIMSLLFSFAELKGWRAEGSNPCFRLKMEVPKPRKRVATWAEFDAALAAADQMGLPAFACALGLSALCGARETDVMLARRDGFKDITLRDADGRQVQQLVWVYVRNKRGNLGHIPVHPEVAPRIRQLLDQPGAPDAPLLIFTGTGAGYNQSNFAKHWQLVRDQAALAVPSIASLQFRDLRRTFAVWSRAGGADKADVGDVLGNSAALNAQLSETYMPAQLDTVSRAVAAIKRPSDSRKKTG